MSKNKSNYRKDISFLIILPNCYGNFKKISEFCRDCTVKERCKKIPPPKEPHWCNPE
ncbi:MAG: hypothetical protein ACXABO_15915 [Promethearchaeota archaeon]